MITRMKTLIFRMCIFLLLIFSGQTAFSQESNNSVALQAGFITSKSQKDFLAYIGELEKPKHIISAEPFTDRVLGITNPFQSESALIEKMKKIAVEKQADAFVLDSIKKQVEEYGFGISGNVTRGFGFAVKLAEPSQEILLNDLKRNPELIRRSAMLNVKKMKVESSIPILLEISKTDREDHAIEAVDVLGIFFDDSPHSISAHNIRAEVIRILKFHGNPNVKLAAARFLIKRDGREVIEEAVLKDDNPTAKEYFKQLLLLH